MVVPRGLYLARHLSTLDILTPLTERFATDKLSFPQVAGSIVPVNVVRVAGFVAMEKQAILTVSIFSSGVVRRLMAQSHSLSGEVPGAAVGPGPVALLRLVCSSNPYASWGLFLQQAIISTHFKTSLHAGASSHEYHRM